MRFRNLILAAALLALAAADRAWADNVYYAGTNNGANLHFWHGGFCGAIRQPSRRASVLEAATRKS